ncbi:MAG TPA: MraY family glycosyltransferase, partial [Thermomicrobiales bacterium]|nr:MraY family glycosyltransferase [Thermomicrobiales bacterium]
SCLLVGALVMCAVGALDDTRRVRALFKLYAQIGVAVLAWCGGFRILAIEVPFLGVLSMGVFALPVTVAWIVGITNAINLIDGLDGLAGSLTLVACAILFLHTYFWPRDDPQFTISLLPAALGGAVLGFLIYNWHPARIILGDAGAYFLGLALAVAAIIGGAKIATTLLALGLPILDVAWVAISRAQRGSSVVQADRGHLHHRLLDLGWSQARIVASVAGASLAFGIASLLLPNRELKLAAIIIVGLVLIGTVVIVATVDEDGNRKLGTRLPGARSR